MKNERRDKSGCAACRYPRVVLHPGGFSARRWRIEQYHSLARELHRKGAGVVLTGSQAEADMFNQHVNSDDAASCLGPESDGAVIGARVDGRDCGESRGGLRSHRPGPYCRSLRCAECQPVRSTAQQSSDALAAARPGVVLRPDVPTCEKCIYEACPYWDCLDRLTVDSGGTTSHGVTPAWPLRSFMRMLNSLLASPLVPARSPIGLGSQHFMPAC